MASIWNVSTIGEGLAFYAITPALFTLVLRIRFIPQIFVKTGVIFFFLLMHSFRNTIPLLWGVLLSFSGLTNL